MSVSGPGLVVGALLMAMVGMLGCEKRSGGGERNLKEVRLGYFANVTHAQAVLGVENGRYAAAVAPAKLTTRVFNAGPALVEALFADQIDIGYIGPGPAINAYGRSRGQGVRIISGAAANGALIVARKDSGISTLADLKGKKIATPQLGNTQDISAKHYVKAVLGQADANNIVPVSNAEQAGMMVRGQIDAAWAPEPWGSRLIVEAGGRLIAEEKDIKALWPGGELALTVVITTPKFLNEHREVVEKLLGAHREQTRRLQAEGVKCADELGAALVKLTGKPLPPGVLEASLGRVRFTDDPLAETLTTMAKWSHELGFAREETSVEGLVDLSVLRGQGAGDRGEGGGK